MIDRKLWTFTFTENTATTPWPCPTCRIGRLTLQREKLHSDVLAESRKVSAEVWWEPEMEVGRFTALLTCNHSDCHEPVVASGRTSLTEFPDPEAPYERLVYERQYHLLTMEPPPLLFPPPKGTPESVNAPLLDSFRLVWLDPAGAANRIRAAIENLVTHLRIPRRQRTKDHRFRHRTLHERIGLLPERHSRIRDHLLAIKWLGNAGSHLAVTTQDVYDALDIVAFVLDDFYLKRGRHIRDLTKEINRRRGPIRR